MFLSILKQSNDNFIYLLPQSCNNLNNIPNSIPHAIQQFAFT